MTKELIIKNNGLIEVDGMKFHSIEGGFGEDKRSILVKDIAQIHNMELKVINQNINRNKKRFINNVDIIDLKSVTQSDRDFLNEVGFGNSSIANSKNIYILSERGYAKLLKILEDDKAWEEYDKLVDGYFNMRKELKEIKLDSYMIDDPIKRAEVWIEEQKEKILLAKTIEKQKPLVEFAKTCQVSNDNILIGELAKIASNNGVKIGAKRLFSKLRELGIIMKKSTDPYQRFIDSGYFKIKQTPYTKYGKVKLGRTTTVTPKGQIYIINKLRKEAI